MRALVIASALLLSSPAFAQQLPDQPAPAEPSERKICKRIDTTGSRLDRKKVCATAKQWEEVSRKAREFTEGMQSRAGRSGMPKGG